MKKKALVSWKEVGDKVHSKDSVTDKLEYLLRLKNEITEPLYKERESLMNKLYSGQALSPVEERRKAEIEKLFWPSKGVLIWPNFYVPIEIKFSLDDQYRNDPSYGMWLIKYWAQSRFNNKVQSPEFLKGISSPLARNFILAELAELSNSKSIEYKAMNLLHEKKIHPFSDKVEYGFEKETEFLRIMADYYINHPLLHLWEGTCLAYQYYCDYKLLRPYLEELLAKCENELKIGKSEESLILLPRAKKKEVFSYTDIAIYLMSISTNQSDEAIAALLEKYETNGRGNTALKIKILGVRNALRKNPKNDIPKSSGNAQKDNPRLRSIAKAKSIASLEKRPDASETLITWERGLIDSIENQRNKKIGLA
jgi:hypothetical protein